jgi:hypothetical protein
MVETADNIEHCSKDPGMDSVEQAVYEKWFAEWAELNGEVMAHGLRYAP